MFGMLIRISFMGEQYEPGEQVRGEAELINNFVESLLSLQYFLGPLAQHFQPTPVTEPWLHFLGHASTKRKRNSLPSHSWLLQAPTGSQGISWGSSIKNGEGEQRKGIAPTPSEL